MRYRTVSEGNLSVTEGGFGSMSVGVYADGETVCRRVGTGNQTTCVTGPAMRAGRFSNQVEHYLAAYLASNQSGLSRSVVNQTAVYTVTATEQPIRLKGTISNYTATAVVRQDGLVRSLNVSYTRHRDGTRRRVQLTVTYEAIDGVELHPPQWYSAARNATVVRRGRPGCQNEFRYPTASSSGSGH
jgi:hypothetical protein